MDNSRLFEMIGGGSGIVAILFIVYRLLTNHFRRSSCVSNGSTLTLELSTSSAKTTAPNNSDAHSKDVETGLSSTREAKEVKGDVSESKGADAKH
jgi:hypothetical protein